jgi:hypothetical protein
MVQRSSDEGLDLQAFLAGAGQSLSGAQSALGAPASLQSEFVLSSAELDAKVTLAADQTGKLFVQPLSSRDAQRATLHADAISTLRINFVATAGGDDALGGAAPSRPATEVIDEIRTRPDVVALQEILGGLTLDATYVSKTQQWLVTARDPKGRIVREVIAPDAPVRP